MRLLAMIGILVAVALAAFSLAMRGLGSWGNFLVFTAATTGLLLVTVNLTGGKAKTQAKAAEPEPQALPQSEGSAASKAA